MTLSLGFSPCPNDTFIFDAWVNKKIDTEGLSIEPVLEDVETLNEWALQGKLDITKLSFPAFFQTLDKYILLNTGSALGKGVGPLLLSRENIRSENPDHYREEISNKKVALPGLNTTANLLFSFAFPSANNKIFIRYDQIENFILKDSLQVSPTSVIALRGTKQVAKQGDLEGAAFGVIIHENRFTYQQKGLHKVIDLGDYWEEKTKMPVPLGGIAIKRSVDRKICVQVDKLIGKSLEYAFAHYPQVSDYVKEHSQTMSEEVMRKHIDLYVNNFSLDLGEDGKNAIAGLHDVFIKQQTSAANSISSNELFLS